jgi:hypothetical protein
MRIWRLLKAVAVAKVTVVLLLIGGVVNAETPKKAVIYVDESTSMKPFGELTAKSVSKLERSLKEKGFEVTVKGFGEGIEELPSLDDYTASQEDTNYGAVFEQLKKEGNKLVFLVTDGRLPSKRLKELPKLRQETAELQDSGVVVCSDSALRKPTAILTSLSAAVKPYGHEEELVKVCTKSFEELQNSLCKKSKDLETVQKNVNKKDKSDPLAIKNINETGFVNLTKGGKAGGKEEEGKKKEGKIVINIYQH